jgi:glyoxylase-like metal-dependent hydrolase (beta-lactamase superfamily II)
VGIDAPAIVELLGLPEHTVVWTGHGDDTTIKAEKAEVPRPVRDA